MQPPIERNSEPISDERLAAMQARCDAATRGPWIVMPDVCGPDGMGVYQEHSLGQICEVADPYPRVGNRPTENMVFTAHARTDLPDALAEIRRLRAELAARDEAIRLATLVNAFRNGAPEPTTTLDEWMLWMHEQGRAEDELAAALNAVSP